MHKRSHIECDLFVIIQWRVVVKLLGCEVVIYLSLFIFIYIFLISTLYFYSKKKKNELYDISSKEKTKYHKGWCVK